MKDWKNCKDLPERLAWSSERARVKAADIAEHVGISSTAVSKWFSGNTGNLQPKHLFKVATFLVVNPRWLATGDDTPFTAIPSVYTEISGPDLAIARALTNLDDKQLRTTIRDLIDAKEAKQPQKAKVHKTAE